jgi:hypothetical protein
LYGLIEDEGDARGFAITNLHRMLSDLTPLLVGRVKRPKQPEQPKSDSPDQSEPPALSEQLEQSKQPSKKRNIILGGDLNASLQCDDTQRGRSHKIFFDRLEDFGLEDVYKVLEMPYPQQTLRYPRSDRKWQNDYFFVSESLYMYKTETKCEIICNEDVKKYSDHNPVLLTLNLDLKMISSKLNNETSKAETPLLDS